MKFGKMHVEKYLTSICFSFRFLFGVPFSTQYQISNSTNSISSIVLFLLILIVRIKLLLIKIVEFDYELVKHYKFIL